MIGVLVIFCAFHNSQKEEVIQTKLGKTLHNNLSGDLLGRLPEQEVEGSDAIPLHHLPPHLLPRCRRHHLVLLLVCNTNVPMHGHTSHSYSLCQIKYHTHGYCRSINRSPPIVWTPYKVEFRNENPLILKKIRVRQG